MMAGILTSVRRKSITLFAALMTALLMVAGSAALWGQSCPTDGGHRVVTADVVALDQPIVLNRLGASIPGGMVFALKRDVVNDKGESCETAKCVAGQVHIRREKRPRPMVLRMNEGDRLDVNFTNLLSPDVPLPGQTYTRMAGLAVPGLELAGNIGSSASWAGANPNSFAVPGDTKTYQYIAKEEGTFFFYSIDENNSNNQGQIASGLFGQLHVEPRNAEWYRSQVTHHDLHLAAYDPGHLPSGARLAQKLDADGKQRTAQVDGQTLPVWILFTAQHGTENQVDVVKKADGQGTPEKLYAVTGHPIINYQAVYPGTNVPILNMVRRNGNACEVVYTDLTAVITGPDAGMFSFSQNGPSFFNVPSSPDRREPFREFTIIYHNNGNVIQAWEQMNNSNNPLYNTLANGFDNFGINYGMAGIGAEILANRLGRGPEATCVDCKYEEFFLSSWVVGDPAMVVDIPADAPNQAVGNPDEGLGIKANHLLSAAPPAPPKNLLAAAAAAARQEPENQNLLIKAPLQERFAPLPLVPVRANKVFYPDDPSNVYHSYMGEHVKFRISNASLNQTHVHHQHAHQWLHTPNSDTSDYLDSQFIVPGAAYTLEINYNGSGNRNQTVGDSIFHCHFYPHFADGMWSLWRVHDVFEAGTILDANGVVAKGTSVWNRPLPDGEIRTGTPIPAIVPLPTLGMAPIPARVELAEEGKRAITLPEQQASSSCFNMEGGCYKNPGFPFFIPGMGGHRAPHPPMDFAWEEDAQGNPKLTASGGRHYLDGGLPRHLVLNGKIVREFHTKWDFTKDFYFEDASGKFGGLTAYQLPEEGTEIERVAMHTHATRSRATVLPNGLAGNFTLNGLPPAPGAPFAAPDVSDQGDSVTSVRKYKAAAIQTNVVFNKKGWHYPQQRMISLWNDVHDMVNSNVPQQPLFFRANSGETVEFWHTNLVPAYYELDDFQVRTPTDILGQHIHLVKFDVLASDGAANGFNYEDGTFSPDDVRDRIHAINLGNGGGSGIFVWNNTLNACLNSPGPFDPCLASHTTREALTVKPSDPIFGRAPAGQDWNGAQTTIQRWFADPVLDNRGRDRTLRTVFTHDHFGPSTHQQAGLYAGLLIEPQGSEWFKPDGTKMYTRPDGGPTGWSANIITADPAESFREFALEYQDLQLGYGPKSPYQLGGAMQSLFTTSANYTSQLNACTIPLALKGEFRLNGVTLSDKAVVKKGTSGACAAPWVITDNGGSDVGGLFTLQAGSTQAVSITMHPNWLSTSNALTPSSPPGLISFGSNGTFSVNYRNEPLPWRVYKPSTGSDPNANPNSPNLAYALQSIERQDPALNCQPPLGSPITNVTTTPCVAPTPTPTPSPVPSPTPFIFPKQALTPGMGSFDPYTPLLRAYQNDRVQVRILVGAHFVPHPLQIEGVNWLSEPSSPNSGYRSGQGTGLSEHFEMLFKVPTTGQASNDFLYATSGSTSGWTNGNWGLLRAYSLSQAAQPGLTPLPNNQNAQTAPTVCTNANRSYTIVASNQTITFNNRGQLTNLSTFNTTPINNTNGLVYTLQGSSGAPTAPIILRANAGDCIAITLVNQFTSSAPVFSATSAAGRPFGKSGSDPSVAPTIQLSYSSTAGITPQLLAFNVNSSAGNNVGQNPIQTTVPSGGTPNQQTYMWYAGRIGPDGKGIPVEFGAVNLMPADPLLQHTQGMIGALIVEPAGSTPSSWTGSSATVTKADGSKFQEFVALVQTEANQSGSSTKGALNYGTEPYSYRQPTVSFTASSVPASCLDKPGPVCSQLQTVFSTNKFPLTSQAVINLISAWTVNTTVGSNAVSYSISEGGRNLIVNSSNGSLLFTTPATANDVSQLTKGNVTSQLAHVFLRHSSPMPAAGCTTCVTGSPQWEIRDALGTTCVNGQPQSNTSGVAGTLGTWTYLLAPASAGSSNLNVSLASNISGVLSNATVLCKDPQTPIFTVVAGIPVRMRLLYPKGTNSQTFMLRGHVWQEEPYREGSSELGNNPASEWRGTQQISPGETFNALLSNAGGTFNIPGDYLYNFFLNGNNGLWGVLRVQPPTNTAQETSPTTASPGGR